LKTKNIGLIIVIIGLIMTLYNGFNFVTNEKVAEIGNVQITHDKENVASWSPFIGIGIMVIGGGVYLLGKKK
jgi:LPXTG-motif cell wall-anchored protein